MALVKADRKELERGTMERSPRSLFADETVVEFVESGMDCAKADGYEEIGNTSQISVAIRNRLASRKLRGIKCATRKGVIYIYKEAPND